MAQRNGKEAEKLGLFQFTETLSCVLLSDLTKCSRVSRRAF